jgi:hypothetical protein
MLICLLAGALVPAALAGPAVFGDGSLAVRGAAGDPGQAVVTITITGAVVGQIDHGRVMIDDPSSSDGPPAIVTGDEKRREVSSTATMYSGTDVRFRAVGGRYRIRIFGSGISVNAIGQGNVRLVGSSFLAPSAWYAVNGGDKKPLPDLGVSFPLAAGG